MLGKLTRNSLKKIISVRGGGHGWARPDPPLNERYE
jgi:hypothetical protein